MSETIGANETTIPLLHTHDPEATLAFYDMLGFEVTWKQFRPYVYLALRRGGFELHFGAAPEGLDPGVEETGGALVMVDDEAAHRRAKSALKRHPDAPAEVRATAHATLVELTTALDRPEEARRWRAELGRIMNEELTEEERRRVERELGHAVELREWRGDE